MTSTLALISRSGSEDRRSRDETHDFLMDGHMQGQKATVTNEMDCATYLERIGYRGGREPTAANLAALVRAHRLAVPYETLDLWRRRSTTLRLKEIYDKIVTRRRGGYCFELNGLFAWLLRELGYNVREYFGRWLLGEDQSTVPMRRHRVVCVAIAGAPNQIVDVGIGLPFMMSPLDFTFGVPQLRDNRSYRIVRDSELGAVVEVRKGTEWMRLFSYDTALQLPVDFEYAHWWCQTHPDSSFLSGLWIYRPLADGGAISISLEEDPERPGCGEKGLVLAHFDGCGEMEKTALRGEDALTAALAAEFGIVER